MAQQAWQSTCKLTESLLQAVSISERPIFEADSNLRKVFSVGRDDVSLVGMIDGEASSTYCVQKSFAFWFVDPSTFIRNGSTGERVTSLPSNSAWRSWKSKLRDHPSYRACAMERTMYR